MSRRYTCPHCGATSSANETCEDRFNAVLAVELAAPAYFAVHQLLVISYMLQHNGYSREAWLGMRRLLVQFLAGLTSEEFRRRDSAALDSGRRTHSITRGPKLAEVDQIVWTRTIAEVRLDTAEHYRADVRAWAESVARDSETLVRLVDAEG
jgi:hypothetical protein